MGWESVLVIHNDGIPGRSSPASIPARRLPLADLSQKGETRFKETDSASPAKEGLMNPVSANTIIVIPLPTIKDELPMIPFREKVN